MQNSEKSKNFPRAGWYNGAIRPEEVDAVAKRLLGITAGLALLQGLRLGGLWLLVYSPGRGAWRTACTRPPTWVWRPFCCWPRGGGQGWRSAFCPGPAAPLEAAVWKVLAGTVFGLIFGAARYKSGRICPSLLLHMAVNTFGS